MFIKYFTKSSLKPHFYVQPLWECVVHIFESKSNMGSFVVFQSSYQHTHSTQHTHTSPYIETRKSSNIFILHIIMYGKEKETVCWAERERESICARMSLFSISSSSQEWHVFRFKKSGDQRNTLHPSETINRIYSRLWLVDWLFGLVWFGWLAGGQSKRTRCEHKRVCAVQLWRRNPWIWFYGCCVVLYESFMAEWTVSTKQ